jgi:hypothetical protein
MLLVYGNKHHGNSKASAHKAGNTKQPQAQTGQDLLYGEDAFSDCFESPQGKSSSASHRFCRHCIPLREVRS